ITQGLGAGSKPDVGRAAAEESIEAVMSELADCNMVFITAGMGGGTGTGAAPVIARAARERGILTVGVVTKPFDFEGQRRMGQAETGIEEMQEHVDTLIVIPNQNLFRIANERTTFADAFHMADTVLHQGVAGVTDLMIKPGQINLDFADIRSVMCEMGKAMMGTGEASGEGRATQAAEAAINNPLLDDISMAGARAVLINVTGGMDMTLFEVDEAANRIRDEIDTDSVIIFGSTFDEKLDGIMRVSIVATGIETAAARRETPTFIKAPTSRPSTVISAPTGLAEPSMTAAPETAELPEPPALPETTAPSVEDSLPAATAQTPDIDEAGPAGIDDTPVAEEPKPSPRLAFLAIGTGGSRELPLSREHEAKVETDNGSQMSLEQAIANERAAAFGTGMPADTAGDAADQQADPDDGGQSVMVADTPEELTAPRRAFVPAPPVAMPESESVPETGPAGGKTSLINKISNLWTAKPSEEAVAERREPEVDTPAEATAEEPEASETPSILDLPRADMMSRMPEPAALDQQSDDLEIPAFLRRQAN
ncbi:MAG: cell division protein FtsZ, partial [Pseudomonadota bacterium]|nr:cell division protein FtsZ [Pseudomonadota bacterium]